jgi:GT2 family glycosyltransferase
VRRKTHPSYSRLYSRVVLGVRRRLPQPLKNLLKRVWDPWPKRLAIPAVAPQIDPTESTTYDVVCFSIIDWSLMAKLADAGHRVFFFKIAGSLLPDARTFHAAKLRENVWEIALAPPVTFDVLNELRREFGIVAAVSAVQAATWTSVAEEARARFGWKVVYDSGTADTSPARAATLRDAIRNAHVKVSIIVVTYFNRELTRLCLDAVFRTTLHPNFEVIVVDNASTDGTPEMLEEYARTHDNVRVILNHANLGFAAANNQGIRAATGDVLVLLNNDTVPARGWLPRMLRHLEDPKIGIVVAVTNFSGNESRIAVPYRTLDEMPEFAEEYARANEGKVFDIHVAAMYCAGLRRDTYDEIGPLDEEFTVGMFEDDDYSHRARLAGLRVVCAEDVFVHHFGQASFGKLPKKEYDAIWRRNQAHYQQKWGITWRPHGGRS